MKTLSFPIFRPQSAPYRPQTIHVDPKQSMSTPNSPYRSQTVHIDPKNSDSLPDTPPLSKISDSVSLISEPISFPIDTSPTF